MITALTAAGIVAAGLGASQEPEAEKVSVRLERTYNPDETQAYTFSFALEMPEAGELKMSGGFTRKVIEMLDEGWAEIETSIDSMTVSFGDVEMPTGELPEPETEKFDKYGMPAKIDLSGNESIAIVLLGGYVPAMEVELKGKFPIEWESEDGEITIEGEGELVATGRLYEEHVAKLELNFTFSPVDEAAGELKVTAYVNSETCKLVKAVGTVTIDDPNAGEITGSFEVKKVRDK